MAFHREFYNIGIHTQRARFGHMGKPKGLVRLMRPLNCVLMGFAVFVGVVLTGQNLSNIAWLNVTFGFLTGFALTGASMAINDYYDRAIDAINEPLRPIPSGLVNPREALLLASFLSVIGFIFAVLVSAWCLVVAVIAWVIFTTYITVGKRTGLPGNFLVSACVGAPFVYGSVIAKDFVVL